MATTGLEGRPWYYGILAGVVVGALLGFAGWKLYLSKWEQDIEAKKGQLAELQQKIQEGEAAERKLPEFQARVQRLELDLQKLLRILPDKRKVHDLIRQFRAIAEREDFDLLRFSPGAEQEQEYFNEWPIDLTVEGSYHNLARFFDRMSRFSRIINVDTLRVAAKRGDPTKTLNASFTAKTYVYKEAEEEIAPQPAGGAP